MKKRHSRLFTFFWGAFVFAYVAISFVVAFYATNYVYQISRVSLPLLVTQLINTFLGLLLTGLTMSAFSRFFMRRQFDAFSPIIQAMERIAKGDFSIRLDDSLDDGMLSGLVVSVNKMAHELGQMENMRQEFISNVSHEIQSPLTSIRGFAQALKSNHLSEAERRHYLDIIETESTRLSRLADDLLKLASLESDEVKFDPQPFRLDKQIVSLILTCEPQWSEKKIDMDADLNEVTLTGDEDLLSQVWLNLLHNSIKFTPQSGSIRIALRQNGERAEFSITDTGIGIAAEDQVHIFERFYKADKSRTRTKEGSGLGLSIVKKIVDLHKGTIDLESALGEGATFTVILPINQAEVP
jgi:signal transduction histidine kinase